MSSARRRRDDRAAREERARRATRKARVTRPGAPPGAAADPTFPYLTVDQGARLRTLAREAFAEAGVETVAGPDAVRAPDGSAYGLAGLAAACVDATRDGDESAWPALARVYARDALATDAAAPLASLPPEDVGARVHLRLVGLATLPERAGGWFGYGRHVAGDLVELLAVDEPGGVRLLRDDDVAAFPPGVLRAAGLANLLRVEVEEHQVLQGPQGQRLHVVTGGSPYTASLLLVLPELLHRTLGPAAGPALAPDGDGVLVAVPFRHQVVFAPVEPATLLECLESLLDTAVRGFEQGVGSLSPFVYWWHDGRLTQVTVLTEDGRWVVDDTGEFGALLDRLLEPVPAEG